MIVLLFLGVASAVDLQEGLSSELSTVLKDTAAAFEHHWHLTAREEPLLPIGLDDVEAWMDLGAVVQPDDVELFALPPSEQAGQGGDFNSAPQPVPIEGRLKRVRRAFGEGRALVINSLHRWCPKAARLAASLREQAGLPVDVYMYLTPPYSHSYGLHSDVMDAFMVQLVGQKHWKACDGDNCTEVNTAKGDILYLPMGAKHGAWTGEELSAHLTVNVERQFYVWGSIFQALAKRLLLPDAMSQLDKLVDMRPFGIEEEGPDAMLVRLVKQMSEHLPVLMHMPNAVLSHTRNGTRLSGKRMEKQWSALLTEIRALDQPRRFRLSWQRTGRTFASFNDMVQEMSEADEKTTRAGLTWVASLIERSVKAMHEQHARSRLPRYASDADGKQRPSQQLGSLASARAARLKKTEL